MALFSKALSDTDLKKRLRVPTNALQYFGLQQGDRFVDLMVKDSDGAVWRFRCDTRSAGFPKPIFGASWLEFVRAKELRCRDVMVFYQEDDDATGAGYRIEVKRSVRIMSKNVWAVVA